MSEIKVIELPETAVIGKLGLCTKGNNLAKEMWKQANEHFSEIASIALKNEKGLCLALWGAMSDPEMNFLPWTENFTKGYYLAGVQTAMDAEAPEGWTKWILPARSYIAAAVVPETYSQVFKEVISEVIPGKGMKLSGAVCDYTDPMEGKDYLYFPVKSKE